MVWIKQVAVHKTEFFDLKKTGHCS